MHWLKTPPTLIRAFLTLLPVNNEYKLTVYNLFVIPFAYLEDDAAKRIKKSEILTIAFSSQIPPYFTEGVFALHVCLSHVVTSCQWVLTNRLSMFFIPFPDFNNIIESEPKTLESIICKLRGRMTDQTLHLFRLTEAITFLFALTCF